MPLGGCSRRRWRGRLPLAGSRAAQAPSTRARRAGVWPACVMAPCRRRAPADDAAGIRPRACIRGRGVAKRVKSPRAAPVVTAPVNGTPRTAGSASTPGDKRHEVTYSWRACSKRGRRAVCAVPARPYAWKTRCCAGPGQPTALSHRRWAGPQGAWPVERLAWRRHGAAWRAALASARARHRARLAASSTGGTSPGVRSPARLRRAQWTAWRRSVFTRSPAWWGLNAGATTQQTEPVVRRYRERQAPHGPASETTLRGCAVAGRVRPRVSRSTCRVPMGPRSITAAS